MTERHIRRFRRSGVASDVESITDKWASWERNLKVIMREQGYVPVLDIVPARVVVFDKKTGFFSYRLTVQGVYVGKRKAEQLEGILGNREITKSIKTSKSEPSLAPSVS